MDLSEPEALVFDRTVLSLGALEKKFFAAGMLDRDLPSPVVVPLDRVFDDFGSQLVLYVEAYLESLREAGLVYLCDLRAS